jgi:DNA-binding LacI/PurR family transcriptional regulator
LEIKKPVSIDDVARAAGVAPSTVSKTLNRTTQRRRPTEIQLRIRRVAAELGYRPNHTARSLSKGCTDIVGLYWAFDFNTLDPFFAQFVNGVREGCRKHLKDVLMHGTFHKHPLNDLYEELTDGKTDGLILFPLIDEVVNQKLAEANFPVVTIAYHATGIPVVCLDSDSGARLAAEKVAARGHKKVIYRDLMDGVKIDNRFEVFQATADKHGVEVVRTQADDWYGTLSEYEKHLLSLPAAERPTAAACFNDTFARKLLAHAVRNGMSVPGDLAIVGFDGAFEWHEHPQSLSTVRAPWDLVAEKAVDILVDRIENRAVPPKTTIPVEWIDGETL